MADHPTRQRLIRLIRESRGCTIRDLRKQTSLSRSTLRQHLGAMTRQGLVEGRFVRRATGRPPLVYRLTPKGEFAAPETYAAFLRALFAGMHVEGRERIEGLFQQVADQLATAHPEIRNITNVGARIEAARRLFFSEVDSTETKVTENGFQFSIHTCPLAPLSMEFGDLCCVTRQAISKLVGRDVEQSEWIIRGDPRCTFEVRTAAGARGLPEDKDRPPHPNPLPKGERDVSMEEVRAWIRGLGSSGSSTFSRPSSWPGPCMR